MLNLNLIGSNTTKLSFAFAGAFIVSPGATVAVGPNVPVFIPAGQTFTDNGTLSFSSGDTVTFDVNCCYSTQQIAVGGTLSATGTTFTSSNSSGISNIAVGPGGHLEASSSTFGITQISLDNSSILNSGDLTGDIFNSLVAVPYGDVQYLGSNTSFQQITINAGTIASGALNLNLIGTNTTKLSYAFAGAFTIALGATVAVGPNVPVAMAAGQTFTDNGTLSFSSGDTVTLDVNCCYSTQQLAVGGTLTASGTTFNSSNNSGVSSIAIGAGGHLEASGSTFNITSLSLDSSSILNSGDLTGDAFNLPISVPYGDVQYLGNNVSFQQISINSGTITGGTLNLNLIGTNTTKLVYAMGPFTIASGATVAVGPNVSFAVLAGQTLTDNGTLNFATGDTVTFDVSCCYSTQQIAVGGTLTATDTTFNSSSTSGTSNLTVNSGGHLNVTGGPIALSAVTLNSGSAASLSGDSFSSKILVNSAANTGGQNNPTITGNDFSNVPAAGVVASGDPNATIYLSGNYWGTTDPVGIAAKITDHNDNKNLPTIMFSPYVANGASGTVASPLSPTFSPTDQTLTLSATVTTSLGVPINEGTETFTILNGTQVVGQTTAPANVSNGNVSAQYTLPGNTAAGQYIIEANYSGTVNYLPSSDALHFLTISPASTSTNTGSLSTTFSAITDQTLSLSATVNSGAGAINEGIVTFSIILNGNIVGSSVNGNVVAGSANANYTFPEGSPGGSYTIQAVYTDPVDFTMSTGRNQLTVNAAATTLNVGGATANFSEISSEGFTLSATVFSAAGTANEGSVTFKILNTSGATIAGPFVMTVSGGSAGGNAFLPAATPLGTYVIQAVYNGTASFATSLPATANLVVSAAATTTMAATTSTPFSSASQSVSLSAMVNSTAGTVSEGTVTFTILNGQTVIGSPVPANVGSGSASAVYTLPGGTAEGAYTIQAVYADASGSFLGSSDLSHYLTVTQPPATKLVLFTPPLGTATAGTAFSTQPVIYEEDQLGNLATGDNTTVVTVSLAAGAGPLQGTLTETVTGGIATFNDLADNLAETIALKFSSGNLSPATSGNIVVSPAAASKLVVTGQPSPTATAGQIFATQPIVKEEDQFGNVINTDSTSTVTVARGSVGTAAIQGSTLTVTLSSGVATFAGLSYDKAQTMNLAFTTNASGVAAASSNNIAVSPAAATQLVINQQPSPNATAGVLFPTQPVVYEEDAFNNVLAGDYTTVITALLNSGAGPLQGTTQITVSGGVANFTNLADNLAETISLKFTSSTLASLASNSILVGPAPAAQLVIHTAPSTTATAGQPFAVQPVIYILDSNGNLESGDNTSVITASLSSGSGPLGGTVAATASGGIVTFTNLVDDTAETIALKFSGDGLTVGPTNTITISPGPAFRLLIHTQPATAATAGQAFSTQPVVYEVDKYGNLESADNTTALTASVATGNGPLVGTTTITLIGGIGTFGNVADQSAGSMSLLFSGGGLTVGPSSSVNIASGPASQLSVETPPYATVVAGTPLTDPVVIDEVDQFGNVVTSDNTTQVTASLNSGSGTLIGTTTVTVHDGVASFDNLENDTAGMLTLQFDAGTLPTVVSSPSVVTPAAAMKVVVTRPPGGVVSGNAIKITVTAQDPFNNTDTSYNGPVSVALASGSSGTLTGTTMMMASSGVADFSDLVDTTSGSIAITASSGTLASGSTGQVTVNPAPAAKLVVQMQPSQSATAGVAFQTQPVIYEEDAFGNLLNNDNSTVVTAYLGSGAGPLGGTVAETVIGGIATFSDLFDNAAGTITLQFMGAGLNSIPTVPIVISPAAASKLVVQSPLSSSAIAGQPFASPPVIAEVDKFGNVETSDSTTQVGVSLASGAGPLQGLTSVALNDGVATFTNLADDLAETITLSFAGGGFTAGPATVAVKSGGGKQTRHQDRAVVDCHGRPSVPDSARHLGRGPVRQFGNHRQQHAPGSVIGQRPGAASGHHLGRLKQWNRQIHQPRRRYRRDCDN